MPSTHRRRRRDSTIELSRVGDVYCGVWRSFVNAGSIVMHLTQRLRFGGPLADIVRFTNLLTYLLNTPSSGPSLWLDA